jgi:hypothetical protein
VVFERDLAAQVLFDFAARKPEELSLTKGEMLSSVRKVTDEWSHGKNAAGKAGTFPSAYVVVIDLSKVKKTALAKFDFAATKPDRISFSKNEQIDVFVEVSSEWWLGRNAAGQTGLFPASYVVELDASAASAKKSSSSGATKDAPVQTSGYVSAPGREPSERSGGNKGGFTSATLKDFPIQFKMPSQAGPSLRIGQSDNTPEGMASRSEAKDKLKELAALLASQ